MKSTRQLFDVPTAPQRSGAQPLPRPAMELRRVARPIAVEAWDPTRGAKRLLWTGLIGMLVCALVFSALNTFSARTHYVDLNLLVILTYLVFTVAGLVSAWTFLKGFWGYLFPRISP